MTKIQRDIVKWGEWNPISQCLRLHTKDNTLHHEGGGSFREGEERARNSGNKVLMVPSRTDLVAIPEFSFHTARVPFPLVAISHTSSPRMPPITLGWGGGLLSLNSASDSGPGEMWEADWVHLCRVYHFEGLFGGRWLLTLFPPLLNNFWSALWHFY